MKKLILILAILAVATPAFALDINLVRQGTTNKVDIRYTGADPCNLPRAFALVIDINSTADVCGLTGYKTGVSTSSSRGYGIYPATIDINAAGEVLSYGNPIASAGDPLPVGADQVLPSKKLVLEFGSLYSPVNDSTNAPAVDGNLCTLTVDCNNASGNVELKMTGENSYRIGGVANSGIVLEDGTVVTVSKSLAYTCGAPPLKCLKTTATEFTEWQTWGEPNCWCFQRQCRGDTNGKKAGAYWISSADLNLLKRALSKDDPCLATISYSGVPGICADLNHKKAGSYRVSSTDLTALKKFLSKDEANVPCCDMALPDPCNCILSPNDIYNFWTN